MKKTIAIITTTILILSGCAKHSGNIKDDLLGTWEMIEARKNGDVISYTFYADNTLLVNVKDGSKSHEMKVPYEIVDDKIYYFKDSSDKKERIRYDGESIFMKTIIDDNLEAYLELKRKK